MSDNRLYYKNQFCLSLHFTEQELRIETRKETNVLIPISLLLTRLFRDAFGIFDCFFIFITLIQSIDAFTRALSTSPIVQRTHSTHLRISWRPKNLLPWIYWDDLILMLTLILKLKSIGESPLCLHVKLSLFPLISVTCWDRGFLIPPPIASIIVV